MPYSDTIGFYDKHAMIVIRDIKRLNEKYNVKITFEKTHFKVVAQTALMLLQASTHIKTLMDMSIKKEEEAKHAVIIQNFIETNGY